jgi:hypothetical protein
MPLAESSVMACATPDKKGLESSLLPLPHFTSTGRGAVVRFALIKADKSTLLTLKQAFTVSHLVFDSHP